jgi:hypothetical protein
MSAKKQELAAITELEEGMLMHISGITTDGKIWRTIRYETGSWLPFENVGDIAGKLTFPRDVGIQSFDYNLHICVIDNFGKLWHAIRHFDGRWHSFINVRAFPASMPRFLLKVALGRVGSSHGGELHVCGITSDSGLWHTIRRADGSWLHFSDVEAQTGDRGAIVAAACAGNAAGELHLCAVSSDGHLWHTIRRADGTWFLFGDVEGQAGDRGVFLDVDCTVINNELHVCGVTNDGHLWHTIRRIDGSWTPFIDVGGATGDRKQFFHISMSEAYAGELAVVGIDEDGGLRHTIRQTDETWIPFSDAEAHAGERGEFITVSTHGIYIAP